MYFISHYKNSSSSNTFQAQASLRQIKKAPCLFPSLSTLVSNIKGLLFHYKLSVSLLTYCVCQYILSSSFPLLFQLLTRFLLLQSVLLLILIFIFAFPLFKVDLKGLQNNKRFGFIVKKINFIKCINTLSIISNLYKNRVSERTLLL